MSLLKATRGHALLFLASVALAASPVGPVASAKQADGGSEAIARSADGQLRLMEDAPAPPPAIGGFARFGIWDSPAMHFADGFNALRMRYRSAIPAGTDRFLALRASSDGQRWGEWKWDMVDGASATFPETQRWAQYRVVLLGTKRETPIVSEVVVIPETRVQSKNAEEGAPQAAAVVAPTYRLRVTRMGMVGRRTANGHVIKRGDIFVSLPSWTSLSTRKGREYQVRLSANGRSIVAPVMDVGPWNRNDNFWDDKRVKYKDLPVGWPQDHAAFYENYNRRRAEKGFVRFPTAVDVGDGAYWALGLSGGQATVDVTFLWKGRDPGPNPRPLNSKPSERPAQPMP